MKKVFSILLCAAMLLSCTVMAFADDAGVIHITSLPAPTGGTAVGAISIQPQAKAKTMLLPGESPIDPDYSTLANFGDVDASAWYAAGLAWCAGNGLLNGKSETKMAPFDNITRGEIVTMLWRVEGRPVLDYFMQYSDVKGSEYYGDAVRWATAEKIVRGYEDGTFQPAKPITREELAQIIYNYAKLKGNGFTGSWMFMLDYQDAAEVGSWANEAMHWCVMKKIVAGSDGKLLPKALATRAEAATMFMRLNPEVAAQETPIIPVVGGWSKYSEAQELDMTKIPEGAKEAFELATKGLLGASYKPIAYLGSQVVAGANYKFLCEVAAVTPDSAAAIKEVVVYKALDGTATITSATELSADLIGEDGRIAFPTEGFVGGYYYGDAAGSAIEKKIADAFEKATEDLLGVHYEPLAVIGQQVVAGVNYAIAVKATTVTADPTSAVGVVKLYVGVDGTNTMTIMGNLK